MLASCRLSIIGAMKRQTPIPRGGRAESDPASLQGLSGPEGLDDVSPGLQILQAFQAFQALQALPGLAGLQDGLSGLLGLPTPRADAMIPQVGANVLPLPSRRRGDPKPGQLTAESIAAWPGCTEVGHPVRLPDGDGLFVHSRSPGGKKVWRLRVTGPDGRENTPTLGDVDQLSPEKARRAAEVARTLIRAGINVSEVQAERVAQLKFSTLTFGAVADWWWQTSKDSGIWKTDKYAAEIRSRLDNHLKTHRIWNVPLRQTSVALAQVAIDRCTENSVSTGTKVRSYVLQIGEFAETKGIMPVCPLKSLKPSIAQRAYRKKSKKGNNYAALRMGPRVGDLLHHSANSSASWQVIKGTWLQAHTFERSENIANALWEHFDLDAGLWTIPREFMKIEDQSGGGEDLNFRAQHIVCLTPEVVAMLRTLNRETSPWMFYSPRDVAKPLTEEALEKHLRRLGFAGQHVPHGWRSTASTYLNDLTTPGGKRVFARDDIELALDHKVGTKTERDYNRGVAIKRQRPIYKAWSDALTNVQQEAADRAHGRDAAPAQERKDPRGRK